MLEIDSFHDKNINNNSNSLIKDCEINRTYNSQQGSSLLFPPYDQFGSFKLSFENTKNKKVSSIQKQKQSSTLQSQASESKTKPSSQLSSRTRKYILYPGISKIKPLLDIFFMILLFMDFIISPFFYFFQLGHKNDISSLTREIIFDILFTIEIIITFFTGYFDHSLERIVTDHKSIARYYITHSFIIDITAVIPFYFIFHNKHFLFIRLIKLYRYPHVISQIKNFLYFLYGLCFKSIRPRTKLTEVTVFFISLIYILHLCSCIYVFIGLFFIHKSGYEKTWITQFICELNDDHTITLTNKAIFQIYIGSLYQICQTFTTTGYGDLIPITTEEIVFLMFCEIVNCGLFAYLLTSILEIFNFKENSLKFKYQVKKADLQKWILNFMSHLPQQSLEKNLHRDQIWRDVKRYFELHYQTEKNFTWITKFDFLKQIKPLHRKELLNDAFDKIKTKFNSFFNGIESCSIIHMIIANLQTTIQLKRSVIIKENDLIRKVYFIEKGVVSIRKNNIQVGILQHGLFFGLEGMFYSKAPFTYEVHEYVKRNIVNEFAILYWIDYDLLFKDILSYDEQALRKVQKRANKYMKKILEHEDGERNIDLMEENVDSYFVAQPVMSDVLGEQGLVDGEDEDEGNVNMLGNMVELCRKEEEYKEEERMLDEYEKRIELMQMQIEFINRNGEGNEDEEMKE